MQLTFATYNIHKAVGLDRRRNPDRILAVLNEIDADVVALQEADRRIGRRESVLPLDHIEDYSPYRAVPLNHRPDSLGWHGNALLVRRTIQLAEAAVVPLPVIEPRGAIRADLIAGGQRFRVVGMHLDLSGLRRRQQLRAILAHLARCDHHCPTVVMGDCNEWSVRRGALGEFAAPWRVLAPGRSFPARQPIARFDRIALSAEWTVAEAQVHHSALAARASDHLPVWARLELPKI
ncbi:MAG: endonuclease/exonuclease/phosphatase family protein [Novosphingobium sp.]|uniref:endonuclease/exonuclease/phosphatase family protein n=1 Tax=Novosphingobium sp. TaxID=1874826 RepID=UPI0032BAD41D